jgi:hypothetical protein
VIQMEPDEETIDDQVNNVWTHWSVATEQRLIIQDHRRRIATISPRRLQRGRNS